MQNKSLQRVSSQNVANPKFHPIISKFLKGLSQNKTKEQRRLAGKEIRDYVIIQSQRVSKEQFTSFMVEINKILADLARRNDRNDKLCGLAVIDELTGITEEDNATRIPRINYLKLFINSNDIVVVKKAAEILGHLAVIGDPLTINLLEFYMKNALENIETSSKDRAEIGKRHSALIILRELAINAPSLFFTYVPEFVNVIFVAVCDSKKAVRMDAIAAFRAFMDVISHRESLMRADWHLQIYNQAKGQLSNSSNQPETVHGSLMVMGELFRKSGEFMAPPRYEEACDEIFKYLGDRNSLICRTVASLSPILAQYRPEIFYSRYFDSCMAFLMRQVRAREDKAIVIQAIGEMALAIGENMTAWQTQIIAILKDAFLMKRGKFISDDVTCQAAFACISLMTRSLGSKFASSLHSELLERMFQRGLSSPSFTPTLSDITLYIPSLKPIIQKRLLDMVSVILSKTTYKIPGSGKINTSVNEKTPLDYDFQTKTLAIRTLGDFDFSDYNLTLFVNDIVLAYLDDPHSQMRCETAITCSNLLVKCLKSPESKYYNKILKTVIQKLVVTGITDPDSSVRSCVLSHLDSHFDKFLCLQENVVAICKGLSDELFEIRDLTIKIVGRLVKLNPAYAMAPIRKALLYILIEIECSNSSKAVEESACLLAELIRNSGNIMRPYVQAIVKALRDKVQDPNPGVVTHVLSSLGELGRVTGTGMKEYMDDLLPMIIDTLFDQSSVSKREVALRTIGQLCQNTGLVIKPYLMHEKLLDTLLGFLKTERTSTSIRKELIKVLGILGALDPYKYKLSQAPIKDYEENVENGNLDTSNRDQTINMSPTHTSYYQNIAINALMNLMADPSLSAHYPLIVQALDIMVRTLGEGFIPFLSKIVPILLSRLGHAEPGFQSKLFQTLGRIVLVVKQHIRKFVPEIMKVVIECWKIDPLHNSVVPLVQTVAHVTGSDFRQYVPEIMPIILQVFSGEISELRQSTVQILKTLEILDKNLDDYFHLVYPVILRLILSTDIKYEFRIYSAQTLEWLLFTVSVSQHASSIIQPLCRVICETPNEILQNECLSALMVLVYRMGPDFKIFSPTVTKLLAKCPIPSSNYDRLIEALAGQELTLDDLNPNLKTKKQFGDFQSVDTSKKYYCNQQKLRVAWEASQRSTKDDWIEWIRRLSTELLLESPSPALRACGELAKVYNPLASELFNAGFLSCWNELYEPLQDELVSSLKIALESGSIPPEITQTLLNLAEFMEHDDKKLPIDPKLLSKYANKCHAYAKELHYKEYEFLTEPSSDCIEALISVNNQLKQPEAATGILAYARKNDKTMKIKESWYEKLGRWSEALDAYESRALENEDLDCVLGRMRCLNALGRWDELHVYSQEKWKTATDSMRRDMAPMAAAAAWGVSDWKRMQQHVGAMRRESPDGAFFRSILAIHKNMFPLAQQYIDETRELLDTELTALAGESYNRAYRVVVRVQMLTELEEIISYKQGNVDEKSFIRSLWSDRLKGCQKNTEVWQRILTVRSLVISPNEDADMHLKFSALCRKQNLMNLSYKTLVTLLGYDAKQSFQQGQPYLHLRTNNPKITFAYLKHIWAEANLNPNSMDSEHLKRLCLDQFDGFVQSLMVTPLPTEQDREERRQLLARCLLKLGDWKQAITETWNENYMKEVLKCYKDATQYDRNWYKAWHTWALTNFQTVSHYEKANDQQSIRDIGRLRSLINRHTSIAISGFFRSISLSQGHSLQDTLRLLTLWFKYGSYDEVGVAMNDGVKHASMDTWLQVIPQLIARIHTPSTPVRQSIHNILMKVGQFHPQALIYPLTVASKSLSQTRKNAALEITEKIRANNAKLVDQALLVSNELIRTAILWHEMWHEGLEDASRMWFGEENFQAMYRTLEPLHAMIKNPETLREISFNQNFERDLFDAHECTTRYEQTKNERDLSRAWELYYSVFRRIAKQLHQLTSLDLQYVSPKLLNAKDLDIAVPGTYRSSVPVVRIVCLAPTLSVITSKQRPRKLTISGSDGKDYNYLLKGHEDLRQDERVMQLFGLLNNLLAANPETFKRHLHIQRYAVIPLSPKSGLIGWVPHCDTLHSLIKDYRETRKILLNIEQRIMLQMAPDYDQLTVPQKTEVFDHALDTTTGQDLYKVLWLRSHNSESWLDRRTNYTRSFAVMSMVGYILGLGDRHPSNLMLDRFSGKILHIDFGDCFEVAMHREKVPEKVPFRLTRMLVKAMEVSGIEGNYRITCNHTMGVLRENRDSVMAVLEAFVYDPLINWRLMETTKKMAAVGNDLADESGAYTAYRVRSKSVYEQHDELVDQQPEVLSQRAVSVINRVQAKLTGRDFKPTESLLVETQVDYLIQHATSHENLCQLYVGWCPFW